MCCRFSSFWIWFISKLMIDRTQNIYKIHSLKTELGILIKDMLFIDISLAKEYFDKNLLILVDISLFICDNYLFSLNVFCKLHSGS